MTFDPEPNICVEQSALSIKWQFPDDPEDEEDYFFSCASSPTVAYVENGETDTLIFAQGNLDGSTYLVALDPATAGSADPFEWQVNLGTANALAIKQTPGVGPIDDDMNDRNFIYVSKFNDNTTDPHIYAVYSDNGALPGKASINSFDTCDPPPPAPCPRILTGTLASPTLREDGGLFIGSDDYGIYAFANELSSGNLVSRATPRDYSSYISSTAGVFPDGHLILWREGPSGTIKRIYDSGTTLDTVTESANAALAGGIAVWGAPALDAANRFYISTGDTNDNCTDDFDRRVFAFHNSATLESPPQIPPAWNEGYYLPPGTCGGDQFLRKPFRGPPAIDEDGTLIVSNEGYVLALRPLLGDLDGDGTVTCEDADQLFVLAIFPESWEENIGAELGVNLTGVGDCNNNGVMDYYDLDCLELAICALCEECGSFMMGGGEGNLTAPEIFAIIREMHGD